MSNTSHPSEAKRRDSLSVIRALSPLVILLAGCTGGETTVVTAERVSNGDVPSWEEFKAKATYTEDGVVEYILDGDIRVDEDFLRSAYESQYVNPVEKSTVAQKNGSDLKWTNAQKTALGYCIQNTFSAAMKEKVIADMRAATSQWMSAANVVFTYLPARDALCNGGYTGVGNDIKINILNGASNRSDLPGHPSQSVVNTSIYGNYTCDPNNGCAYATGGYTVLGLFIHELGHALGFGHEQYSSPCNGTPDDPALTYRLINSYDSQSAMHYPSPLVPACPSQSRGQMTALDKAGLASLYGAPTSSKIEALPVEWLLNTGSILL